LAPKPLTLPARCQNCTRCPMTAQPAIGLPPWQLQPNQKVRQPVEKHRIATQNGAAAAKRRGQIGAVADEHRDASTDTRRARAASAIGRPWTAKWLMSSAPERVVPNRHRGRQGYQSQAARNPETADQLRERISTVRSSCGSRPAA